MKRFFQGHLGRTLQLMLLDFILAASLTRTSVRTNISVLELIHLSLYWGSNRSTAFTVLIKGLVDRCDIGSEAARYSSQKSTLNGAFQRRRSQLFSATHVQQSDLVTRELMTICTTGRLSRCCQASFQVTKNK